MTITKEDLTFRELTNQKITTSSRLNLYDILYNDVENTHFNNIFKHFEVTIEIKTNNNYFTIYTTEEEDWWDNISNVYYGTPTLWYIVCSMNDVVNPYEEIESGQQIKVLKKEYLYNMFKDIQTISKL